MKNVCIDVFENNIMNRQGHAANHYLTYVNNVGPDQSTSMVCRKATEHFRKRQKQIVFVVIEAF